MRLGAVLRHAHACALTVTLLNNMFNSSVRSLVTFYSIPLGNCCGKAQFPYDGNFENLFNTLFVCYIKKNM